jgi:Fe-S cluster assembly protein SufD
MSKTAQSSSIVDAAPETPASLPEWFAAHRREAWQRFVDSPDPTRRDESWRFGNLKQLDFSGIARAGEAAGAVDSLVSRSKALESPLAKFVFVNDRLAAKEGSLPEGVVCMPLGEALTTRGDLVREHFMRREVQLGSAKYAALHAAHVSNGMFVYVPEGVEISGTIEVHHWLAGENAAIFPHTLIVAGANSKVRVVDIFQSATDDEPGLAVAVNDLIAGDGSKLYYLAIQHFNEQTRVIQINDTIVARDASAKGFILNTGASWARNESLSSLEGEGARSDMLSVSIPARGQEYDQRTFQHHASPGAYSDLLYKNSLYDHSRTVFSGLISVDRGAHRTDAYQTCRNLMMNEAAEAHSMPGLEINADDVKCSHGSTAHAIDDSEIFYLRTRGIPPKRARQLIARGFSVEVVARLGDEAAEEMALSFIDDKFHHIASGGA